MKKLFFMMTLGVVVMLMSSCMSTSKSGVIAPIQAEVIPSKEIKADIDLDGNTPIMGNAKQWYFAGIRVSGGNNYFENLSQERSLFGGRTTKAQSCAMYDALTKGDYDMLVNPQYVNKIHSYFFGLVKRYDVTVKGYGAKIKNVHQSK